MAFDVRINLLVGFAVGMAATLILRDWQDIDRHDVITFLGVVVAIAGAIFSGELLERRKSKAQHRRDMLRLQHAVRMVGRISAFVPIPTAHYPMPPAQVVVIQRYMHFEHMSQAFGYALDRAILDNMGTFSAASVLRHMLDSHLEAFAAARQGLLNGAVPADFVDRMSAQLDDYLVFVDRQVLALSAALNADLGSRVQPLNGT